MYERILIPTDGSDSAGRAITSALSISSRFDAQCHGIFVLDTREIPQGIEVDLTQLLTDQGESALDSFEAAANETDVSTVVELIEGSNRIHEEILAYADAKESDLIVMGSHGRRGLERFLLGSVAEHTLRHASIPVMIVRSEPIDKSIDRILLPTDGSRGASAAIAHALELATAFDATLHVINVVDVHALTGEHLSHTIYQEFERMGQEAVDSVIEDANDAGVESIEASVLTGTPSRSITEYVDERDIDLIVMGTHGRSGIQRYLLGSVTERVLRTASTPVLTVPSITNE